MVCVCLFGRERGEQRNRDKDRKRETKREDKTNPIMYMFYISQVLLSHPEMTLSCF